MSAIAIKTVGAFVIFFVCAVGGFRKGHGFVLRAEMLNDIISFLQTIQTSLRYRRDTTYETLQTAIQLCKPQTLCFKVDFNAPTLPENIKMALEFITDQTKGVLTQVEMGIFCDVLQQLGQKSTEEEEQKLCYAISCLQQFASDARAQAKTEQKLYRTLGITGGAALALLFI